MRFKTPEQMLGYINDNHDLYSRKAETYIFNYNEAGSVCSYHIDEEKAKELSIKAKADGEYWGAFLGTGGEIWDDPSHECYRNGQKTNLDRCAELLEYEDWILTEHYLGEPIKLTVQMTVNFKQEDVDDIMCSALEGGITYWCNCAEVAEKEYYGEFASEQISRGGSLRLYDFEEGKPHILNLEKFIDGFKKWLSEGYDRYGAVQKGEIDCCDIDAECADQIVQMALFGDVIYG